MFFNIPPPFVFSTYLTVRVESITKKKMSNVKYIKTFRVTEVNVHTSDIEHKFLIPFSGSRGIPGLCRSHVKFKCLHS